MGLNSLFGGKSKTVSMPWKPLKTVAELDQLMADSTTRPQLLFKHSTRCSISGMALARLEKEWNLEGKVDAWYLDLLAHKNISNTVAKLLNVEHESPQAILVVNEKAAHVDSHSGITVRNIAKAIA
jgi:bacillithiol system protein YtxJ